jgi:hypothetical protein
MQIYDYEFKNVKNLDDISNLEIIISHKFTDKIINKYYNVFEKIKDSEDFIESIPDIICFMLTRFKNEYIITNVLDEDGIGHQIDIDKNLFDEILNIVIN